MLGLVLFLANASAIAHTLNVDPIMPISVILGGSLITAFGNVNAGVFFVDFTQGLCANIQKSLIEVYGQNSPQMMRKQTGFLDALRSPYNMQGVSYIPIDPGNGKIRKVMLKYLQRGVESAIVHEPHENCTPELEIAPKDALYDITHYIGTKWFLFDERNMRKLCEADSQYRADVINAHLGTLMTALNKQLLTIQLANMGKFNPDISPADHKDVTLITANDGANYMGEIDILNDMEALEVPEKPMVIGNGKLGSYVRLAKIGCCNEVGADLGQIGNFMFYKDLDANSVLGTDKFISMAPGKVQLLTWNKFVGDYKKVNDVFIHDTFIDPATGLKLDIHVKYDDCAEAWAIQYGMYYELTYLPSDAFASGDDLEGVNFTLLYEALKAGA